MEVKVYRCYFHSGFTRKKLVIRWKIEHQLSFTCWQHNSTVVATSLGDEILKLTTVTTSKAATFIGGEIFHLVATSVVAVVATSCTDTGTELAVLRKSALSSSAKIELSITRCKILILQCSAMTLMKRFIYMVFRICTLWLVWELRTYELRL